MTAFHPHEDFREDPELLFRRYEALDQLREFRRKFEETAGEFPYREEILALISAAETLTAPDQNAGTKDQRRENIQKSLVSVLQSFNLTIKPEDR